MDKGVLLDNIEAVKFLGCDNGFVIMQEKYLDTLFLRDVWTHDYLFYSVSYKYLF